MNSSLLWLKISNHRAIKTLMFFSRIIDTKMMSCRKPLSDKLENSMLSALVKSLMMPPFDLADIGI
jgi:hypothetical protein